jgi:DNA polymerase III epsilon subunit-like protein
MKYVFYVADIETTGLDSHAHDVIELSLLKLGATGDDAQKTWCFKPLNPDTIDAEALRINGHKLDDLLHKTREGRERYIDPSTAIVDVENWLADDGFPAEKRFLIGQNIGFDKDRLEQLWLKCNAKGSFPFGRRLMDTMYIELFIDFCKQTLGIGDFAEGYSLKNLGKKYGVKNDKAHTAAADTKATKEIFDKQVEYFCALLTGKKPDIG